MRVRLVIAVGALLLLTAGCTDPYGTAGKLGLDVAQSVGQAAQTADQLRTAGTITAAEERTVLGWAQVITTANGSYLTCVAQAHTSAGKAAGFLACAQSFLATATNPQTLRALHVTNPAAQQKVLTYETAISTAINGVILAEQSFAAKGQ